MNQGPGNNNVLAGEAEPVGGSVFVTKEQVMDSIQGQQQQNVNYNVAQLQQQNTNDSRNLREKAYVKILEQPAGKALRFRYECEGRSAGSIPGVNSTAENKTYPTIEIVGYKGRAVVVVSCVTKDQPYRPHPHNLVGKEGCKKGVCTLEINPETMRALFSNLGIQCVKKKDIEAALKAREEIRVDPFKTGFTHRFHPSGIDLNSVRLCFQVFTESDQKGRFTQPLPPVVSEPIYDKKAMCDLVICRLCSCSSSVLGNTQIILLCEKVAKEDITVRLFEEKDGQTIWEAFGEFQHTDVHKQTAIAFRTPRYRKMDISEPAKVLIQLKRPSDGVTSEALPFQYIPLDSGRKRFLDLRQKPDLDIFEEILSTAVKEQEPTADPAHLKRKRQKTHDDPVHFLLEQKKGQQQKEHQVDHTSPQHFGMYRTPSELWSHRSFGAPGGHWEAKFNPASGNDLRNLKSDNPNTCHNPLPTASVPAAPVSDQNNTCCNLASKQFQPNHLQYPSNPPQSEGVATGKNGSVSNAAGAALNANCVSNANRIEHGLSNLLTMDSDQLVRINSEDQQMLRLNSEDLQISSLSIST